MLDQRELHWEIHLRNVSYIRKTYDMPSQCWRITSLVYCCLQLLINQHMYVWYFNLCSTQGKMAEAMKHLQSLTLQGDVDFRFELALGFYRKLRYAESSQGKSCVFISTCTVFAGMSASLAQSAARQSHNLKVVSSSLTGGTFLFFFFFTVTSWYGVDTTI